MSDRVTPCDQLTGIYKKKNTTLGGRLTGQIGILSADWTRPRLPGGPAVWCRAARLPYVSRPAASTHQKIRLVLYGKYDEGVGIVFLIKGSVINLIENIKRCFYVGIC